MAPKKKTTTTKTKQSIESIDQLQSSLEKDFGKGFIVSTDGSLLDVDWMSTGVLSLDYALGKGLPRGKIIEIFGPESSGKTSLAMHCMGKAQRKGGKVALIDAEYSFEPTHAKSLGLNKDDMVLIQPDSGEQALNALQKMVESNLFDIIVVDSVAALTPQAEIDGEMGDHHVGLQARLMSQALRKLNAIIGKTKTNVIFINQLRIKIGVMFGNPETTPGGNALKFYCHVRIDVRRKKWLGSNDHPIGILQNIKVIKNKCAPPFRGTEVRIYYKGGYDIVGDIVETGVECGAVEKAGSWYGYNGERLGQGLENTIAMIKRNKDFLKGIAKAAKKYVFATQDDEEE